MRKARFLLGLALLLAASLYLLPVLQAADEPAPDSPEVSALLAQAKGDAIRLRNDAAVMKSFGLSRMTWRTHTDQINLIKVHANNLGKVLMQLKDKRESASPWQQKAIDHIFPLASEMVSNIDETIDHINNNQSRLNTGQYRDYLSSNYDLASSLSGLISDYVSYGKNKAKYEKLGSEIKAPGH